MKLTEKTKKNLAIAGLGVVCVALVILIASRFAPEAPKEVSAQPTSTVSEAVDPGIPSIEPSKTPAVIVQPIDPTATSVQPVDTGDSKGTEQSIQAEVTKPTEPAKEILTDHTKTPDGQKVDTVKPVEHDKVTKPENLPASDTPKSGDKKNGKIYVPGFGWIDDNGGGVQQNDVGSDGDINKQVGNMD